jgi:hypothetical protein
VRLSRCEVRDHINYRKNDRWPSYRFYRALQRLKSPMRYICEIFGAPRFSSFSTQSAVNRHRIVSSLEMRYPAFAMSELIFIVLCSTSKMTAVDHPNIRAPFIAVMGPSSFQSSTGVTSP